MTESRIPRDLVRAIAIEYIKESKRLGGHLDERAALVQPAATVHEVTDAQLRDAADAAYVAHVKSPHRWDLIVRAVLDTLQPAAELTGCSPDALPRPITREEMREGQVVERATTGRYRVGPTPAGGTLLNHLSAQVSDWYLIEDAPDPDAEVVEAIARALAEDDGRPLEDCADEVQEQYRGNARAVLAVLRERCDITPRGEQ